MARRLSVFYIHNYIYMKYTANAVSTQEIGWRQSAWDRNCWIW
jgi:hypothetical protein